MITLVYPARASTLRMGGHMVLEHDGTEALYLSDLAEAEQFDMDDAELRRVAFEYERDYHAKNFLRMARKNTLEEYLAMKVRLAREHAQRLIEQNEDPSAAWNRAIRVILLERSED